MAAVASSASSTPLITSKTPVTIENSDANRLFVCLGATASMSDYFISLAQYESIKIDFYYGAISGIWSADGTGAAMVTEVS